MEEKFERIKPKQIKHIDKLGGTVFVEKKDCHCCGKKFESYGKHFILCSSCKERDYEDFELNYG